MDSWRCVHSLLLLFIINSIISRAYAQCEFNYNLTTPSIAKKCFVAIPSNETVVETTIHAWRRFQRFYPFLDTAPVNFTDGLNRLTYHKNQSDWNFHISMSNLVASLLDGETRYVPPTPYQVVVRLPYLLRHTMVKDKFHTYIDAVNPAFDFAFLDGGDLKLEDFEIHVGKRVVSINDIPPIDYLLTLGLSAQLSSSEHISFNLGVRYFAERPAVLFSHVIPNVDSEKIEFFDGSSINAPYQLELPSLYKSVEDVIQAAEGLPISQLLGFTYSSWNWNSEGLAVIASSTYASFSMTSTGTKLGILRISRLPDIDSTSTEFQDFAEVIEGMKNVTSVNTDLIIDLSGSFGGSACVAWGLLTAISAIGVEPHLTDVLSPTYLDVVLSDVTQSEEFMELIDELYVSEVDGKTAPSAMPNFESGGRVNVSAALSPRCEESYYNISRLLADSRSFQWRKVYIVSNGILTGATALLISLARERDAFQGIITYGGVPLHSSARFMPFMISIGAGSGASMNLANRSGIMTEHSSAFSNAFIAHQHLTNDTRQLNIFGDIHISHWDDNSNRIDLYSAAISAAETLVNPPLIIDGPTRYIDWSKVPKEAPIKSFDAEAATCECDLTEYACDFNCCCDTECETKFTYCLPSAPSSNSYDCGDGSNVVKVNLQNTEHKITKDGILCVARNNNAKAAYLPFQEGIDSVSQFEKLIAVQPVSFPSFSPSGATIEVVPYEFETRIPVIFQKNVEKPLIGYLPLPAPVLTGECDDFVATTFMKPANNECTRYVPNMSTACENLRSLNGLTYIQDINFFINPGLSDDTSKNNTLAPRLGLLQCDSGDGNLRRCSIQKVVPSPTLDNSTDLCRNVVTGVEFAFTYSLRSGVIVLEDVKVNYIFSNIPLGIGVKDYPPYLTQKHSVVFYKIGNDATNTFYRSGNIGYITGKPLLAGIATVDQENSTNKAILLSTDRSTWLTLARPSNGGSCRSSMTRETITFGEDLLLGCTLELTFSDLDSPAKCKSIREETIRYLRSNANLNADHIGMYGSSDYQDIHQWVEILDRQFPQFPLVVDSEPGVCHNIIAGLHVEVLVSNVGSLNNPQRKIIGSRLLFDERSWKFLCGGPYCQDETLTQTFVITSAVSFVDVTPKPRIFVPRAPDIVAKFPYDFFYPFLTNAAGATPRLSLYDQLGIVILVIITSLAM